MQVYFFVLLALCGAALAIPIVPEAEGDISAVETAFYDLCAKTDTVKCAGAWSKSENEAGACFVNKNCTNAIAMEQTDAGFVFHMIALNDVGYVALGFSNDTGMGAEAVVACIKNDTGVFGSLSYNNGKKNELAETNDGLNLVEGSADNGILSCTVTLDDTLTYARHGTEESLYYIVGASGTLNADGTLGHHAGHIISDEMWALAKSNTPAQDAFYELCETEGTKCAGSWLSERDEGNCFDFKNCTNIIAMETNDDGHVFHLLSYNISYISIGFSNDTGMGEEAVVTCVERDGKVVGELSYDVGYKNIRAKDDEGLNVQEAKVEDGVIYCKFTLENPLTYAQHEESFSDEEYYIVGAAGILKDDGTLGYHYGGRIVSSEKWTISGASAVVSSALLAAAAFLVAFRF